MTDNNVIDLDRRDENERPPADIVKKTELSHEQDSEI